MTVFNFLKEHANKIACEYTVVSFPLVYNALSDLVGFTTEEGQYFPQGFSNDGLTYVLYRLGTYVDRDKARGLFHTSLSDFVNYINGCRAWQETENLRLKKKKLILATSRGKVEGLLTHYNPVSHLSLIERVVQSPIKDNVTGYFLSPKDMIIKFHSKYVVDNKAAFGLAVRNGETGHVVLSYNLFVESGDFMFLFPLKDKRRHLSKVEEVDRRLVDVFDAAGEVDLDALLKTSAPTDIPLKLLSGLDKVQHIFDQNNSLHGVVEDLLQLRGTRGFKGQATKALEIVLNFKLGD